MAEDEEPARGVPLSPKSTNPIARPALGVRAPFKRPGGANPGAAFKKPFRSPMVNAPVDRVVPTSVARVSETEGAPAKSLMAGHMTPFIGKPRPQVGLAAIKRPNPIATAKPMVPTPDKLYFSCLYAKRKSAKNRSSKSWVDGIAINQHPTTTLLDMTGKIVAKGKAGTCVEGTTMEIGNWEVEIQDSVSEESFLSGAALAGGSTAPPPAALRAPPAVRNAAPFRPAVGSVRALEKLPLEKQSLHDASKEGSIVLSSAGVDLPEGRSNFTVVVDPFIGRHLRPHQRDGVRFMYECVVGLRRGGASGSTHKGCLLAHEMGMGKTLQVIALLWTLLKQGPIAGKPVVRKAVIACPASLVGNWGGEIKKWLNDTRLEPLLVEGGEGADGKQKFEDWALPNQRRHCVLVTSYETLRSHAKTVQKATGGIDLLVCDEAHRLKNTKGDTQTVAALRALRCDRRVLLTGTPIQNDLGEFFAVMDFACPGLLGDASVFKKVFSNPVEASRDKHATAEEKRIGAARSAELGRMTREFVHRASARDVNAKHLPPKTEYVVFVRPSPVQAALYRAVLRRGARDGSQPLRALQQLQRLCNSASLLMRAQGEGEEGEEIGGSMSDLVSKVPKGYPDPSDPRVPAHDEAMSGKLAVLIRMLQGMRQGIDKTVIVSGYTSTLDIIAEACLVMGGKVSRLDGSVPPNQRVPLVNSFNAGRGGDVFLLSTKAGGVGLNLVGANRLVLFDSDWNPANDLQALARVWRDGQKRPVTIYRLVSTGTVEEKIFQRQMLKGDVASCMGYVATSAAEAGRSSKGDGSKMSFSKEELKDLFKFNPVTQCDTVDVLKSEGKQTTVTGEKREVPEHWRASAADEIEGCEEEPLARALGEVHRGPSGCDGGLDPKDSTVPGCPMVSFVCRLPALASAPVPPEDVERGDSVSEPAEDEGDKGDDDDDDDA